MLLTRTRHASRDTHGGCERANRSNSAQGHWLPKRRARRRCCGTPSVSSPWCSTSTSASAARPARWPARRCGPATRAWSTCGGPRSTRSPARARRATGSTWAAASATRSRKPASCRARDFGEAWDFNYDEVFFGGKGNSVHLQPSGDPDWGPNWDEDQGGGQYPNSFYFYLPRICNHCTHPACLEACPRNAIYKREEDGIVLISEERCKGYRFCMEACPYKKIYFNHTRKLSQKCIFCYPRIEKGVAPACARQCPGPPALRRLPRRRERADPQAGEAVAGGAAAASRARHGAQRLLRAADLAAALRRRRQHRRVEAAHSDGVPEATSSATRSKARSPR